MKPAAGSGLIEERNSAEYHFARVNGGGGINSIEEGGNGVTP